MHDRLQITLVLKLDKGFYYRRQAHTLSLEVASEVRRRDDSREGLGRADVPVLCESWEKGLSLDPTHNT
jgi:hypothetical protein